MIQLFESVGGAADPKTGAMSNMTGADQKRFRDLAGLYADEAAFGAMRGGRDDTVVYEALEFRPGDRVFGVTRMLPGKVGAEYFVTRGLMPMESPDGEAHIDDDGKGGWKQIDNPNWRPNWCMRDAATIAALYGQDKKEETA